MRNTVVLLLFVMSACGKPQPTADQPKAPLTAAQKDAAERHANLEAFKHNPSVVDRSKASAPIHPRIDTRTSHDMPSMHHH